MESLDKIIESLIELKKAVNSVLPKLPQLPVGPKSIQSPSMNVPRTTTRIPGTSAGSKKDPKKVAEQLKSGQPPKPQIKQDLVKFDKNGQWYLDQE